MSFYIEKDNDPFEAVKQEGRLPDGPAAVVELMPSIIKLGSEATGVRSSASPSQS